MSRRSGDKATPCTYGGGSCGNKTTDPSGLCHAHRHLSAASAAAASGKARDAALAADAAAQAVDAGDQAEAPDAHVRRIEPGDHVIGMISGLDSGDWRPVRLRRAGDSVFAECHAGPPDDLLQVRTSMFPASEYRADEMLRLLRKALSARNYTVRAADNQPMPVGPGRFGMHIEPEVEGGLTAQAGGFLGQILDRRYWVELEQLRVADALEEDDWRKFELGTFGLSKAKSDYLEYLDSAAKELDTLQAVIEAERRAAHGFPNEPDAPEGPL